jgi:hypothetical protein
MYLIDESGEKRNALEVDALKTVNIADDSLPSVLEADQLGAMHRTEGKRCDEMQFINEKS